MATNEEYEISVIENETDAHICAKLLAEEFSLNNPFSIFNQSTADKLFDTWIWPAMMDILNEKLLFLVRHRSTNEIIAAIMAIDLFLECERHPYDASSPASDRSVADLFDETCDQFVHHDLEQKLKPNTVLSISAVATQSKHSRKGLAAQLSTRVCDHARDTEGFQYAFVQTNHPGTRYIYVNKMNGKEMTILDPATWLWKRKDGDSSRPFKDYKGEPVVNILVKLK